MKSLLDEAQELAEWQGRARASAAAFAGAVRAEFGPRVRWIRLYGSLARGDWLGPDESDIDLAVVLDRREPTDEDRIFALAGAMSRTHDDLVLSPRVFAAAEFARLLERELLYAEEVMREGVPL
ncbi:MAG: nucleotidyltransferase domain-containing protein [Opitutae bacterium]|nr:nucleotidyltransferase domain-containing protein [Opitutae bacterium]